MSNPEFHTCSSCAYTWRHGANGSHSCSQNLRDHLDYTLIAAGLNPSGFSTDEKIRALKSRIDDLVALERNLKGA